MIMKLKFFTQSNLEIIIYFSAKSAVYGWWSNLGKNVNNLEIDKNAITSSDTNLSKTSSIDYETNCSSSKSTTGLKLSNSFTSFTLASLIKASEESVSSALSTINRTETKDEQKNDAKIENV